MSLRPRPARWFEILVARDDLICAVDVLAHTGSVQLETHSEVSRRITIPDLRERFEDFNRLQRRYQHYWPTEDLHPTDIPGQPGKRLNQAITVLTNWQQNADPLIEELERLKVEKRELTQLYNMLQHGRMDQMDFRFIANAGPVLAARLFVLPVSAHLAHLPPAVLSIRVATDEQVYVLVLGKVNDVNAMQRDLTAVKGRAIAVPNWVEGNPSEASEQISRRLADIGIQTTALEKQLVELCERFKLTEVLGDIKQLEWFITHVSDLPVSENFAWITGWTNKLNNDQLTPLLERSSIRTVVHYPPAPVDLQPPMVMQNPWWIKPFELFANMLGMPARNEADPSVLLALIVPLIFGYMFGDVGHGLIVLLIGLFLQRRWPLFRIFIGCGLASVVFGFVFGSVFGFENVIKPLWVSPIEEPLTVLLTPLLGGIIILLLGLTLNGFQAYWRGEIGRWLSIEAAVMVLYVGALFSAFDSRALYIVGFAIIWYFTGSAFTVKTQRTRQMFIALGQLVESLFQLIINTISFVRVGAFALAHAGLSLTVIILSESTTNIVIAAIIFILGTILILVLEGLVVLIQTTRLVLFEFFIRFLRGTGRLFQPLTAP